MSIQSDSLNSFKTMMERHSARIARLCMIYANNPSDQKDLFQDIIYSAWKAWPSFRGESSPGTWIYQIGLRVGMRYYRGHKSTVSLQGLSTENISAPHEQVRDPDIEALSLCIKQLSIIDRQIILLYLEELSNQDIADLIGISKNHLSVKLGRIRKKLSLCMKEKL